MLRRGSPLTFFASRSAPLLDSRKYQKDTKGVNEKLPEKISGSFTDDYDIIYVDAIIRRVLLQEQKNKPAILQMQLRKIQEKITETQTFLERQATLERSSQIKIQLQEIESGQRLIRYEERVKELLSLYRKLQTKKRVITFEEGDVFKPSDQETLQRIDIIEKYLKIAGEYIFLDIVYCPKVCKNLCPGCSFSLEDVAVDPDGLQCCPFCQTEHYVLSNERSDKESNRTIISSSIEDESIVNFEKALDYYQGLQMDRPPEELYLKLDDYFKRCNRPIGEVIRSLPLNGDWYRGDTDHKMLWTALSEIKHSEFLEQSNLIGHLYWGWTLPNVQEKREQILNIYRKTQAVYYSIPSEERRRYSSLGTQYRLWRALQLVDHIRPANHFKIADNPESLKTHNRLWRLMCEGANDPDIYYIE